MRIKTAAARNSFAVSSAKRVKRYASRSGEARRPLATNPALAMQRRPALTPPHRTRVPRCHTASAPAGPAPTPVAAATDVAASDVSFGGTNVAAFFARLRMHLATSRFLAERRRDAIWAAGSDYAALSIARLATRLSAATLAKSLRLGAGGLGAGGASGVCPKTTDAPPAAMRPAPINGPPTAGIHSHRPRHTCLQPSPRLRTASPALKGAR